MKQKRKNETKKQMATLVYHNLCYCHTTGKKAVRYDTIKSLDIVGVVIEELSLFLI